MVRPSFVLRAPSGRGRMGSTEGYTIVRAVSVWFEGVYHVFCVAFWRREHYPVSGAAPRPSFAAEFAAHFRLLTEVTKGVFGHSNRGGGGVSGTVGETAPAYGLASCRDICFGLTSRAGRPHPLPILALAVSEQDPAPESTHQPGPASGPIRKGGDDR